MTDFRVLQSTKALLRVGSFSHSALCAALDIPELRSTAIEAILALDDPELHRSLLGRVPALKIDDARTVLRGTARVLPLAEVTAAAASDSRLKVLEDWVLHMTAAQRSAAAKKAPSLATSLFVYDLGVSPSAIEKHLAKNAAPPHHATLLGAVSDGLDTELAARLVTDVLDSEDRKSQWWAPMLATHLLLNQPGVLPYLAENQWRDTALSTRALAHLLTGPFFGADADLANSLVSRAISELGEVDTWEERVLFWTSRRGLHVTPEVASQISEWVLARTDDSELRTAAERPVPEWTGPARLRLADRLTGGLTPFGADPEGISYTEFLEQCPDIGRKPLYLPGISYPERSLAGARLSVEVWLEMAVAADLLRWAHPRRTSGYQAIRLFYPAALRGVFSELALAETKEVEGQPSAQVSAIEVYVEHAFVSVLRSSETPARLRFATPPEPPDILYKPSAFSSSPESEELVTELEAALGEDTDQWKALFELSITTGLSLSAALAVLR